MIQINLNRLYLAQDLLKRMVKELRPDVVLIYNKWKWFADKRMRASIWLFEGGIFAGVETGRVTRGRDCVAVEMANLTGAIRDSWAVEARAVLERGREIGLWRSAFEGAKGSDPILSGYRKQFQSVLTKRKEGQSLERLVDRGHHEALPETPPAVDTLREDYKAAKKMLKIAICKVKEAA